MKTSTFLQQSIQTLRPWAVAGLLLAATLVATGAEGAAGGWVTAEVALARGEYPTAARRLHEAANTSRDTAVFEKAARLAFDNAQPAELESIANDWLAREPRSEAARRFRAIARLQLDRPQAAADDFRVLIKTAYSTPAAAFSALQESLAGAEFVGAAEIAISDLLRDYPTTPEAWMAHADLALHAGNSPAALKSIERLLALSPSNREALWLRARALVLGGNCDQGLASAAVLARDGSARDRLMHGWLASSCGRGEEAERPLKDLTRIAALKGEALQLLAANALDAGRLDVAEARYREALGAGGAVDVITFGMAQIAERRGQTNQAKQLYSGITEGNRAVAAQLSLYRLLMDSGDDALAARMLDDFVAHSPERLSVTAGRIDVLNERGHAETALSLSARALRVYPDDPTITLARAATLDKSGRMDEALKILKVLRAQRPNDALVANSLGYTLVDHDRDLSTARQLITAALARRPDSAAIQDSYGWLLFRERHFDQAIVWLSKAYDREPQAEVAVHLGEAQWASGDHEAAARTWSSALMRVPDSVILKEVLGARGVAMPDTRASQSP